MVGLSCYIARRGGPEGDTAEYNGDHLPVFYVSALGGYDVQRRWLLEGPVGEFPAHMSSRALILSGAIILPVIFNE